MKRKTIVERLLATVLSVVLVFSSVPMNAFAEVSSPPQVGDTITTATREEPDKIDNFIWVLDENATTECDITPHTHVRSTGDDGCYMRRTISGCGHDDNGNHPLSEYTTTYEYDFCKDPDNHNHTKSIEISLRNYKQLLTGEFGDFLKNKGYTSVTELFNLIGKTICVTVNEDQLNCQHTCSFDNTDCYFLNCRTLEHTHDDNCFQYVWVLQEQVRTIITVTGEVTGTFTGNNIPGETVTITATPNDGKYITGNIKVNGDVYTADVEFDATSATFRYTLPDSDVSEYVFEVETADATISLINEWLNWNKLMTPEEVEESIFDIVNWGSMPDLSRETTIEYVALALDYSSVKVWKTIGTNDIPWGGHAFGEKESETIRLSFPGNAQIPEFKKEFTVTLEDNRLPSVFSVNDEVTFTYSPSVTEDELAKQVFEQAFVSATSEDGLVTLDAQYNQNVFVKNVNVNAGTHTVVLDFYGTKEYKGSLAEVTVTIERAPSYVKVSEAKVKYGSTIDASAMIDTGAAKRMELVVGLSLGEDASTDKSTDASTDISTVAYLNLPSIVDTENLPDDIKSRVDDIISKYLTGNEMSVGELSSALGGIISALNNNKYLIGVLENLGINIDTTSISSLISLLQKIEKMEGVKDLKIVVSIGKKLTLKDSGMYLVCGVVSDANYKTSVGANYAIITPDGYKVVLDWNNKIPNGLISHDAVLKGYDLGASVVEVDKGNIPDAQKHVKTFFMGVDVNGNTTVTDNPMELEIGAYTQIALVVDAGNTMYYAEPIQRVFTVVPQLVDVKVTDGEAVYDGNPHGVEVTISMGDESELDRNCLQVKYVGYDVNGKVYDSANAPVDTGIYTVLATYAEKKNGVIEYAGFDAGILVIKPATAEITVADNDVIYDGKTHMPKITNKKGLELIKVVSDDKGNVNIILPESYGVETKSVNVKDAVDEVMAALENIQFCKNANTDEIVNKIISELEKIDMETIVVQGKEIDVKAMVSKMKEQVEKASDALKDSQIDAVKTRIEALLECVDVKNVTINGTEPTEDGVYTVTVIGYGKNYKVAKAEGVLTIHQHKYTYTAQGNVITQKCKLDTCKELNATATIPVVKCTYNGSASFVKAKLDGPYLEETRVQYYDQDGNLIVDENGYPAFSIADAGTYTAVLFAGEGENKVTAKATLTIQPKNIEEKDVTASLNPENAVYNGNDHEFEITVQYGDQISGITLVENKDFSIKAFDDKNTSVDSFVNAGTYTIYIEGKGNYTGTIKKTFTVNPKDISNSNAEIVLGDALIHTGEPLTQGIKSVTVDGMTLTKDIDYTVSYNTATEVGNYILFITGKGNFTGTAVKIYTIAPGEDSSVTETDDKVVIGSGTVTKDAVTGENTPQISMNNSTKELVEMLVNSNNLTSEELSQIASGASLKLILTVNNATSISDESKKAITDESEGYTIGQYLDITLSKIITINGVQQDSTPLTNTGDMIEITVKIPSELINNNAGINRNYYIVRSHYNTETGKYEATLISGDFKEATQEFTFKTNQFSDYVIVYKDTAKVSNSGTSNNSEPTLVGTYHPVAANASGVKPATGDSANYVLWIAVLGICAIGFVVAKKKKRS